MIHKKCNIAKKDSTQFFELKLFSQISFVMIKNINVCMYVCIYVCMYICMFSYINVCIDINICNYESMLICIYVCKLECKFKYVCVLLHNISHFQCRGHVST